MIKLSTYFLSFNLHPLFYATIACIVGICGQAYYPVYTLPASITVGTVLLVLHTFTNRTLLLSIALPFVCATGAAMYQWQQYKHDQFYVLIGKDLFDVKGKVTSIDILEHARLKKTHNARNSSLQM